MLKASKPGKEKKKEKKKKKEREKCCAVNKRTIRLIWGETKKVFTSSLSFSALQTKLNFAVLKSKSLDRTELSVWREGAKLKGLPGLNIVTELRDRN